MKYYLNYVEGCSSKTVECDTEHEVREFITNFIDKYGTLDDKGDNWIELDKIYYGNRVNVTLSIDIRIEE